MSDDAIIQQAIELLRDEFGGDLIGVLAGGSRLRGEGDPSSDIDLVVVIDQPRRQRRNIVIAGVEVEMFINPPFQIRRYFEEDRHSGRGLLPHLCSTGMIVYDTHDRVAKLRDEAITIWTAGPPPLSDQERWSFRYSAADHLRDIEDVIARDADRAVLLLGVTLDELLRQHYRIAGRWLPKRKRALLDLATWDVLAADLARRATHGDPQARLSALRAFAEHILAPIGGLMPLIWRIEWEELEQ